MIKHSKLYAKRRFFDMKKLLAFILAAIMMVGCTAAFTSCSDDSDLAYGKDYLAVATQLDALNGLRKGDADIAVIDSVMANYYLNTGDTYKDYKILSGVVLAEEQYGIGAKKGNNALIGKINEALIAIKDTEYQAVATKYGLTTELLINASTTNPQAEATDDSWNKIANAPDAKLVIGYTKFAPIAYDEGDGADAQLVGFDIELAKAVVNYLNVTYGKSIEIEFVVIEWNQKESLLENGSIDLVWNGMTITDERKENMAMSVPYLANKQVAVVKKSEAKNYGSNLEEFKENTKDCIFIVEKGSAGEALVAPDSVEE